MTEAAEHEPETVVVDAAAMVDLLADTEYAPAVAARLRNTTLHAPALLDAEVLSALGRLQRAEELTAEELATQLDVPLVTTDQRFARGCPGAEAITI